jgi:hypothetical protein
MNQLDPLLQTNRGLPLVDRILEEMNGTESDSECC